LQLIDYGNHTIDVSRKLGTVVVFDSKLPHKVWPVTFGKRLALVGWASGPRLR
jgi:PKHD-type hydroxylase